MSIDISKIKVVAFDLFGTVFDLSGVPKQEIRDYIAHIRKPKWSPLALPESWKQLPPHPDSKEGIHRIARKIPVVACSNARYRFTSNLLSDCGINMPHDDYPMRITEIQNYQVYKPDPQAYLAVCEQFGPEPHEVLMVTGNEGSPDVEGARAVGMQSILIRQPGTPQTIIELAELLGC